MLSQTVALAVINEKTLEKQATKSSCSRAQGW